MTLWHQHKSIFFALIVYFTFWYGLHPYLGYLLDSDAVAYLTIADRVANGDWLKSINGLWSPLNAWLLVPFIKMGVDAWWVAKILNAFFGGLVLLLVYILFYRLRFNEWTRNLLLAVLVVVLVFFSYFQIFGDVLQLIFALAYVHLFIIPRFYQRKGLILLSAICMGVGFYAKSYSLIFYVLHFSAMGVWVVIKNRSLLQSVLLNWLIGLITIIMIALPWSFQMKEKYGFHAITGLAGKLNMSWYINSDKTFNDSIQLLIPPAYDDSPSFWEDPYLSQGELSKPWTSMHHFTRWVLRVGHTCLVALACTFEISLFYLFIVFYLLYGLIRKKSMPPKPFDDIFLAVLILPLGYLAMHIETRYIWLNTFLIMVLGVYLIKEKKWVIKYTHMTVLLAISFLPFISIKLVNLKDKNKELFQTAEHFKQEGVSGKIVSNINDEGNLWVVAYLASLNNYTIEQEHYSLAKLIGEMDRYGVKYYLHYPEQGGDYHESEDQFQQHFNKVYYDTSAGATLYSLQPH